MTSLETTHALLEDLLLSLVDKEGALTLRANEHTGRIDWTVGVDINDITKIIGKGGAHMRAIRLIVDLMGRAKNPVEIWNFEHDEPEEGLRHRREDMEQPNFHDPEDDTILLSEILSAIGVDCSVAVSGAIAGGFDFSIRPHSQAANQALLEPHEAIYKRWQKEREPLNLAAALGTLWRAVGKKNGVRYRVSVT